MNEQIASPIHDGIPMPERIWAVVAVSIGMVMAMLDGAIANVALPSISADLMTTAAATVWVVNAYQLTVAMVVLPISSASDMLGARRVFWTGLLIFTAASGLCGFSHSLSYLVGARVLQGIGAACIFATYPALIVHSYPRRILGRGTGISATVLALAGALGPTVTAAILSVANWEWLFLVNLPVGLVGLVIGARYLPKKTLIKRRFDVLGAVVTAIVIALLVIGLDGLGRSDERALASGEVALAFVIGFFLLRNQTRFPTPLVPVDLLRIPIIALSFGTSFCSFCAQTAVFLALPFLFQVTMQWSAPMTGLVMTAIPLAVAAIGAFAGRLADRYPVGILCGVGLLLMSSGLLLLAFMPATPAIGDVVWREALVGLGFGLFQAPNNRAILSSGPRSRSGAAGGLVATSRLLGQAVGASIAAVIFEIGGGSATRAVLLFGCIIAFLGAGFSILRMATPVKVL
jgi:DHA2 family multidrug resistance protein-like MFS transporter